MATGINGSISLISSLCIDQIDFGIAHTRIVVNLFHNSRGIITGILTSAFLHIVTGAGRGFLYIDTIVGTTLRTRHHGLIGYTGFASIINNVLCKAGITPFIGFALIKISPDIANWITTFGHRESIYQILTGVHIALTKERWGKVIALFCIIGAQTFTPNNFSRV